MMESQTLRAAVYARVSSEQQAQQKTIDSQLEALKERVGQEGLMLDNELCFVDDGCSGSTLVRPALERLRDVAYAGGVDRLYVHSPDRLARKYAYQVLLVDELTHHGVEIVFLNHALGTSPEEDLLLQVQGVISEYERAKIMERSRRGKRHAARRGSVNVLSGAPYGYRYVSKQEGGGEAHYRMVFEEARIVREIFAWHGVEGASIGEICRRLKSKGIRTRTGKDYWDRTTVWGMLKNPAYKGSAGFGKTRRGRRKPALRPQRRYEQSQRDYSIYTVREEEQERIPVPAIVGEDLFETVQEQLAENKKHNRQRRRGARYLLQGLLKCQCCGYAYYGKPVSRSAAKGKKRDYAYYRCIGTDAYRFGGERVCWNKQVRTDLLEAAVWEDVCALLQDPDRVRQEYQRRLTQQPSNQAAQTEQLSMMIQKVKRGIARLIDAYEDGLLTKAEFEPRLRNAKQRLDKLEAEIQAAADQTAAEDELRLVIGQFEDFAQRVSEGLHEGDWTTRREITRALVKRIEIGPETVRVVYKVAPAPFVAAPDSGGRLQDCWRRAFAPVGEHRPELPGLAPRPSRLPLRAVCRRLRGAVPLRTPD
jgi:site-specific DNA recombinase